VSNQCFHTELTDGQIEALRGTELCTGSVDDEWVNLLVTPNAFSCAAGDAACAWEADGYAAVDPSSKADGDTDGGLTVSGAYDTTACNECATSMQPACAVEKCLIALDPNAVATSTSCSSAALAHSLSLAIALVVPLATFALLLSGIPRMV